MNDDDDEEARRRKIAENAGKALSKTGATVKIEGGKVLAFKRPEVTAERINTIDLNRRPAIADLVNKDDDQGD